MSLKDALAGIKEAQQPESSPVPAGTAKRRAEPVPADTKKTGKSSNPEFEPVKLYVRKTTRRDAVRKWEDETGGDFSELVQTLLAKYLST